MTDPKGASGKMCRRSHGAGNQTQGFPGVMTRWIHHRRLWTDRDGGRGSLKSHQYPRRLRGESTDLRATSSGGEKSLNGGATACHSTASRGRFMGRCSARSDLQTTHVLQIG